jgi:hypothetical protein
MGAETRAIPSTIDDLLARARSGLQRLDPVLAFGSHGSSRPVLVPQPGLFRGVGASAWPLPVRPGATGQARLLAMPGRAG